MYLSHAADKTPVITTTVFVWCGYMLSAVQSDQRFFFFDDCTTTNGHHTPGLAATPSPPNYHRQALTGRKAASLKSSFNDKNLLDLFHQQHHRKAPHPCYRKPRFDGPEFVIMHYAGNVRAEPANLFLVGLVQFDMAGCFGEGIFVFRTRRSCIFCGREKSNRAQETSPERAPLGYVVAAD